MEAHHEAVAAIAANVKQFYNRKEPYRIYHGSTNSTRQSKLRRNQMVDTSGLNHVIQVNPEAKTMLVEPNVPMDSLVEATLKYSLVPPVVMEFPGITVGGGFSGTSGESSSFRYGFFDRTVNSIEMVLASGEIVKASKDSLPDLFYGAASAFGTLGVITLVELQLIEARTYVELTYHPTNSIPDATRKIKEATDDVTVDYVDGILFSKHRGVICTGRLTDTLSPGLKIQSFTRPTDPWYYIHVDRKTKGSSEPFSCAVPIVDYLFRYDRGGFWVGKYAFQYFITPFNRITRWALDHFMHTRVMYHALHKSGLSNRYMIQDVAVPYPAAEEFVEYLDKEFTHYPIWLCPLKQTGISAESPHGLMAEKPAPNAPDVLLNFGVWGPGPKGSQAFINLNRSLERKVDSFGGRKWLYAQAFYTKKEFSSIYDQNDYDALRTKYHASHLPSIYDKVKVDIEAEQRAINASWAAWLLAFVWSIWPLSGLYGVLAALRGGDYLLPRTAARQSKLKKNL
jgi:delta24-sterol reductase